MNRNAGQNDRQSECENDEQSANSLELEADVVRARPQALSNSHPPKLCVDQEVEGQAEVQFLPSLRSPALSEHLPVVKVN